MHLRALLSSVAIVPHLLVLLTSCQSWPKPLPAQAEYFRPSVRVYFDTHSDEADELDVFQDGAVAPAVDFLGIAKPFLVREVTSQVSTARARLEATRQFLSSARETHGQYSAAPLQKETEAAKRSREDRENEALRRVTGLEARQREFEDDLARAEDAEVLRSAKRTTGTRLDGDWVIGPRAALGITSPAGDAESGESSSGAPVVFGSLSAFADFYRNGKSYDDEDAVGVRVEVGYMYGISADEDLGDADDGAWFVGMTVFL